MSPVRPRARAMLSLLGGLGPQLLLLLLRPPAASGDCSLPPDVPNAQATLGGLTSFPEKRTVTYKCNRGFVKVPGKADSVVCQNNKWSELAEFCNRSCDVPTRLLFASLKKSYSQQNYFPEGTTVEYECRQGYIRDPSLSGNITCLQNFVWSKPDRFCKKKSCPKPREIDNGHVNITTDILLGATIYFSCNAGYKLVGAASSFCAPVGNTVGWTDEFPECQETDVIPTVPKSTEVNVPAKSTAVPRTTPRFHATGTPKGRGSAPSVASTVASGCVAVTVIIGIIILVKIFWDSGKSGSYHTHENTKALKFHDSL
ncbi:complement decay-accelerating factor isoform X23 [Bubalus bubalis]|uniref:complement decay-accelerating factor isoform X23 n=1 Tax=Bubalus bubalis TaxID=89462 RepID=UPI001E1B61EB|nr:complement decay-accelerating factor isoform X23 [Bubalus bubalis]